MGEMSGGGGTERPDTGQLRDLHVYIVPSHHWHEVRQLAGSAATKDNVSAGFIRVHPDTTINVLRTEIAHQLDADAVPPNYVFLKLVERHYARVGQRQEYQLRAKHFLPPKAPAPELCLLEVGPEMRQSFSSGASSERSSRSYDPYSLESYRSPHGDKTEFSNKRPLPAINGHDSTASIATQTGEDESPRLSKMSQTSLPNSPTPPRQSNPNNAGPNQTKYRESKSVQTGSPIPRTPPHQAPDPLNERQQDPQIAPRHDPVELRHAPTPPPPAGEPSDGGASSGGEEDELPPLSASPPPPVPAGGRQPQQPEGGGGEYLPPLSASPPPDSADHPSSDELDRRRLEEALRRQREEEEERRRQEEEMERQKRELEEEEARRRRQWQQEQEEARRKEEERQRWEEEERRRRRREAEEEERRREAERLRREEEERRRREEEERFPSPPPPPIINSPVDSSQEKERLLAELEALRRDRRNMERKREDLVKRAKALQAKTQSRRNAARDVWKKKYFEEKKKTPPMEEATNKLRQELDLIHRKIMSTLEGPKDSRHVGGAEPSQQGNIKIQATRLQHDIEDLQRRVENIKMKLTSEMKLRNQAETELKALRAELTQKKINVTLARNQQQPGGGGGLAPGLSGAYTPPLLTPRS